MQEFFKRNIPVFLIGIVTVGVFITIILVASKNPTKGPSLQKIGDEQLVTDITATIGPRDSKVVLVEFSDFECPACKTFHPVVRELINKYSDRVLFAFKHFPLPQHTNARTAAIAAVAAQEQGKFWEYADKLFEAQPDFSREKYIQMAESILLDKEKFTQDLDNAELANRVTEDLAQANRLGLGQTPTFILNNSLVTLTTFGDLDKLIQEELAKTTVDTTTTTETSQSTSTAPSDSPVQQQTTTNTNGTIYMEYGFNGFIPNNAKALLGQQVLIKNTLKTDMRFQQIIYTYTDLQNPITIKAGETLTVDLTKEGLWTFKESDHKHYGSVFTVAGN